MRNALPAFFSLSLFLTGCFSFGDDFGDAVGEGTACIAGEIAVGLGSIFEESRLGEDERVRLVGLCNAFESCDAFAPVMRGAEITVIAEDDPDDVADKQTEPVILSSSNPAALSIEHEKRVCSVMRSTLIADAAGFSTVTVHTQDGEQLDSFAFEVADAASLSLDLPPDDEVALLADEDIVIIQATVRDGDERLLTARGGVTWTVADDGVLIVDDEMPTGGVLIASPGTPGTTIVRASAGGVDAEIEITIP